MGALLVALLYVAAAAALCLPFARRRRGRAERRTIAELAAELEWASLAGDDAEVARLERALHERIAMGNGPHD
jgi:hypothetical protein